MCTPWYILIVLSLILKESMRLLIYSSLSCTTNFNQDINKNAKLSKTVLSYYIIHKLAYVCQFVYVE